jgi:hypothetical protein
LASAADILNMLRKLLATVLVALVALGIYAQVRKAVLASPAPSAAANAAVDLTLDGRSADPGRSAAPLPMLDSVARQNLRQRLAMEPERHYLDSLLTGADSLVRHWPPELEPVPFAIIAGGPAGYLDEMAYEARGAVDAWSSAGAGLRLVETSDTTAALLTIHWVDTLGGERGGYTDVSWDGSGRIRRARIYLATRATVTGRPLGAEARREIALHEIGHALGLPHSSMAADVMYPVAQNPAPTDRDRFSLRLLYQLPTGWIGVAPRGRDNE